MRGTTPHNQGTVIIPSFEKGEDMERSRQSRLLQLLCPVTLALSGSASGKIIYVDDHAFSSGNGSSWSSAYRYLQDALADANTAPKPVEIRVAQGIYRSGAPVQLINGVTLKGGFAGTQADMTFPLDEVVLKGGLVRTRAPDPNARNVRAYQSILSGDLTGDDPDLNDPVDLAHERSYWNNSPTVVTGSGTDRTAVLDGFTITGGYYVSYILSGRAGRDYRPPGSGAGMNNRAGSPTVIGCLFIKNVSREAGGGMCNVQGSHPVVVDCIFRENMASSSGGAVYNYQSHPTFRGCTFSYNELDLYSNGGAAVDSSEGTCVLTDCTFAENGTRYWRGAIRAEKASLTLEGCIFLRNCSYAGGAVYNQTQSADTSFTFLRCLFQENSAGVGGAVSLASPATFVQCTFSGNRSYNWAGAADVGSATFTNCLFAGNAARDSASVHSARSYTAGGAVCSFRNLEFLRFINCTFHENRAARGSAVSTDGSVEFLNCILRGPVPLVRLSYDSTRARLTYCDVSSGWPNEANFDLEPRFARPGYWAHAGTPNDANAVWVEGDYHLKSQAGRWDPTAKTWVVDDVTSPCIDAGDPASPVGGEPSPNGARINMGAYGGTGEASKSPSQQVPSKAIGAGDRRPR